MKQAIEEKLKCLIGLSIFKIVRAANMECFHFGEEHPVFDYKGNLTTVGKFTLNVQCAWRLVGSTGIVVASRDIYYPAGDAENEKADFDWGVPGATRCDERITQFLLDHKDNRPVVQKTEADFTGGATIVMKGGFRLEIFPDNSLSKEHWRIFDPSMVGSHFVVTGQGIKD